MAVSLPADTANAAYAPAILAAVQAGNYVVSWGTVTSTYKGHTAQFRVFSDAMKMDVAGPDGVVHSNVRISVSAYLEQQIADVLGCSLLTPKLADMLWEQRNVTLLPTPRVITSMTNWMVTNSQAIDAQLSAQGNPVGICQTVGKHWVIDASETQHASKGENYGWHFAKSFGGSVWAACASDPTNQNCREIQDPGWFHDMHHLDYSQTCCLVSRLCMLDGVQVDIHSILSDAALAPLASHNGVITYLRQPGVPDISGAAKPAGPGTNVSFLVEGEPNPTMATTDWNAVAWSAGAITLVIGGFFVGLSLAEKAHKNPILTNSIEWRVGKNSYVGRGLLTGARYEIIPTVLRRKDGKPAVYWTLHENGEQIGDGSTDTEELRVIADNFEQATAPTQPMSMSREANEPISPYVFDYRGVKTVITKKRSKWCYGKGKTQCASSFRDAVVTVKNAIDADQS